MKRYSITYLLGQAVKGMLRNRVMSFASILILMACLVVTGSFFALIENINYNIEDIGQLNEIVVYIDETYTEAQVDEIKTKISSLDNVSGCTLVTREEALEQEKAKYAKDYPNLFDSLSGEDNPYRDSIIITYKDNSQVENLEYQLSVIEGINKTVSRTSLAENVESVKNAVSVVFIGFMVVLFVVTLFVIVTTIRLAVFSRRDEIMIMRYVGATNGFVVFPFVFEGILMGVISSLSAFFIQKYVYNFVVKLIATDYRMITVMPFTDLREYLLGGFVLIGIVTGALGSFISANKYLKV